MPHVSRSEAVDCRSHRAALVDDLETHPVYAEEIEMKPKPRNANVLKRNWMKRNRKAVLKARRLGFCIACRRRRPRATYTICDKCRRYQKDRYSRRLPAPATGLEKLERDVVAAAMLEFPELSVCSMTRLRVLAAEELTCPEGHPVNRQQACARLELARRTEKGKK